MVGAGRSIRAEREREALGCHPLQPMSLRQIGNGKGTLLTSYVVPRHGSIDAV